MPNTLAIAYSTTATGGVANTTQTGSFYIGNMNTRQWDGVVIASGGNTVYYASPITSSVGGGAYVLGIPKPGASPTAPQFYHSLVNGEASLTEAAFITTCDYILKHYTALGAVDSLNPVAPLGCSTVGNCQSAFTSAGWFQSYGFVAPA